MKNRTISIIVFSILFTISNFGISEKLIANEENCRDNKIPASSNQLLSQGEHYIDVDGVKLWYLVRGEGPVLILYPSSAGWGGDCSVYIDYFKPWEEYRTVIYLEPRGLGKSERLNSASDYSMVKYVEELEHFRAKLGLEKFDLYGHCFAGMISLQYAIKYGQNLNHLIVMSTWPKLYPGYWEKWSVTRKGDDKMMKRFAEIANENLNGEEKLRENFKNMYAVMFYDYDKHKESFEKIMDSTVYSVLPNIQFGTVDHPNYNIVDSLKNITAKTFIIYGDDDVPMAIEGSKLIHEKIKNSKLLGIKKSSHWSFIEQPKIFFRETKNFLNQ